MALTFLAAFLDLSLTVVAPPVVQAGLPLAILAPRGTSPVAGDIIPITSPADVPTDALTADGAAQVAAAYGQGVSPGTVYVITYDGTTPGNVTNAADIIESAGLPVGVIVCALATDATLDALGTWYAAQAPRRAAYVVIAESRNADLLTSGKPATIDGCEVQGFRVLYGAAALGIAGAYGGWLASRDLTAGPVGAISRLLGVAPFDGTAAQRVLATANDVGLLLPADTGSGASQRLLLGTTDYAGNDWSAVVAGVYACRRLRAEFAAYVLRLGVTGEALRRDVAGLSAVEGVAAAPLDALAAVGYWSPSEALPNGYSAVARVSGTGITVDVTLGLAGAPTSITIPVIAEVS